MGAREVEPILMIPNKRVWIVGPTYNLGELEFRVIWQDMIVGLKLGRERQIRKSYNKRAGDMFIEFPWNTIVEVRSADRPENLVGDGLDYVIMSEAAKHNRETWSRYIQPALADKRGQATFSSCVTGNTMLVTEDGIIEIGSLYSGEAPGTYIPYEQLISGFAGSMEKSSKFYVNGYKDTIKVTNGLGSTLEGTLNHPVWAMRDGNAQWVELQDLRVGDWLATRVGANTWGNSDDTSDFVKDLSHWKTIDFDTTLTPRLMYLLGYIIGNGHIDFVRNRISISTSEPEIQKLIEKMGWKHYESIENMYSWQKTSKILVDFLRYLGFTHVKSPEKFIPARLLKCSSELIRYLLSGLCDADGSAHKTRNSVQFVSTSKKLISQIQIILINFGIVGRITESVSPPTQKVKVWSKKYTLEIAGAHAQLFHEKIGFQLPRKKRTLTTKSNRFYGVPQQSDRIARLFDAYKTGKGYTGPNLTYNLDYLRTNKFSGYEKIEDFLNKISHIAWDDVDYQYLRQLCNERYYWSQVKSLESSSALTFDLTIPTTHAYTGNTMINHNTPNGQNWLHDLWQYGRSPSYSDFESWRFPSWDNPVVYPGGRNDPEILLLERTLPYEWFQQEIAADFTSFLGKIFSEFDEQTHVRKVSYNPMWRNFISFDWGYVNPMAAIEFQVDAMDRVHVWREHYKSGIRLDDFLDELRNREQPPGYKIDLCFGDAADPEAVATVSYKFSPCVAKPASKTNWREGIDLVKSFLMTQQVGEADEYGTPLEEPWLYIDHSCKALIHEMNNYRASSSSSGKTPRNPREDAIKYEDHAIDALRYGLMHIFKLGCTMSLADIYTPGELSTSIGDRGYFTTNTRF